MRTNKHSYVRFYPSHWKGGLAGFPRLVEHVYFQLCMHTWDTAEPISAARLKIMLADLGKQGVEIVDVLVEANKLVRNDDGSVYSPRAMIEAQHAFEQWEKRSIGGQNRQASRSTPKAVKPAQHKAEQPAEQAGNILESGILKEKGESDDSPSAEDMNLVANAWNVMANSTPAPKNGGIARLAKLTDSRKKALRARIKEHGVEAIIAAFETIPRNDFLMGRKNGGWKANWDSMMRPDNCAKLIEGGYEQGEGTQSAWR